ncbi:hypothetical protein [Methanosarcina sp. UBA5]|uniref:hypothetical protein n=1 Tax=Methanosarcina sp. UBA5 TaxID=1915593 RepID=UPI0025EF36EF|nr:hypothetical protein [Methanosarcina sp. UBA5]
MHHTRSSKSDKGLNFKPGEKVLLYLTRDTYLVNRSECIYGNASSSSCSENINREDNISSGSGGRDGAE